MMIMVCQVRDNLVLAVQRQRLIREGKLRAVVCIFMIILIILIIIIIIIILIIREGKQAN